MFRLNPFYTNLIAITFSYNFSKNTSIYFFSKCYSRVIKKRGELIMTHSNPRKCTQVFNLFFILLGPILFSSCSEKIVSDGQSIKQVSSYQYYKNHYIKKETKTYREKLLFSNEERDQFQSFNGKPTEVLFNLLEKRLTLLTS